MELFTVPEIPFKQHSRSLAMSSFIKSDRLDFLSETGKAGYTYIQTKSLK